MKRIWTILITVVATAAIVGGGTWYLIDSHAKKDKDKLQTELDTLNQRIADEAAISGATVTSGTTATTGTTVADPTAGWKTYTDTVFGYSVKYPADWTKGVLAGSATFNSPENEAIKNSGTQNEAYSPNIIIQTVSSLAEFTKFNKDDKTLDSFIRNDATNSKITVTTLDGEKAYKYLTGGIGDAYYQIAAEHNSKVYWIHFSPGELSTTQEKIMSTFKFATSGVTADWKTYTNKDLGLSFKYPQVWGDPVISKTNYSDDPTKDKTVFNGKDYTISFNNYSINVYGVTSDFLAMEASPYLGEKANLDLVETPYITGSSNVSSSLRKKITAAGQKTYYEIGIHYIPEASGVSVSMNSFLNGGTEYKGINISYRLKSINDRLDKFYSSTGDNAVLEAQAKTELTSLVDGTSTDAIASAQYQEFKLWLGTFQFVK